MKKLDREIKLIVQNKVSFCLKEEDKKLLHTYYQHAHYRNGVERKMETFITGVFLYHSTNIALLFIHHSNKQTTCIPIELQLVGEDGSEWRKGYSSSFWLASLPLSIQFTLVLITCTCRQLSE